VAAVVTFLSLWRFFDWLAKRRRLLILGSLNTMGTFNFRFRNLLNFRALALVLLGDGRSLLRFLAELRLQLLDFSLLVLDLLYE